MAWGERIRTWPGRAGSGAFRTALLAALSSALLAPLPATAQEGCEVSLQQASAAFESGRFAEAQAAVDQCLAGKPGRAEKSRALALVAKVHLALDDVAGAEATTTRLLENDPEFQPDVFDPPRFVKLVATVRGRQSAPTVTSVSKSKEPLAQAPATVVVISGEEIARRGYTDLEAVLRDLPGFDFSRRAGAGYSNVYQRGYRSIETTRTMLMIDGVEDNDLASSTAWISRQFPLSNVERIEVVYGPASTMYGANAFAGVINVITKDPEQLVKDGRLWGTDSRVGASTDAGMLDATVAGQTRNGGLRWSLTARKWKGQDFEHLKDDPNWDYDPSFYDGVDYTKLSGLNATTPAAAAALLAKYSPEQLAPWFTVSYDAQGTPVAVTLTAEGAARARGLDRGFYRDVIGGYKQHELDGTDSADVYLANYQRGSLRIEDLLVARSPFLSATYKYRSNDQLRTELNLFWEPSETLNVVGGAELRYSSIGAQNATSPTPPAEETGSTPTGIPGGNQISSRDLGAFVQASWRPVKPLKLVAGVRVDDNKIRESGGFGTVANPRFAAIYGWDDFTFKAIYSEAFQDAPNFQKYEKTATRLLNNPTLAPEKVKNFELSAGWSPHKDLAVQLVGYRATYEGIVEEVFGLPCPAGATCPTGTTSQFQNVGALEILGAQLEGQWSPGRYRFVGTWTYVDPQDTNRDLRVGDIADHRFGLSASARLLGDRLDTNVRLNAAVGRKTGRGTTVTASPFTKIDDYLIAGAAATYRNLLVPGLDLQLSVENLFDSTWYEPSLRNPSGFPIAARIPQPGRTFFLRLRMTR